MIKHSKRREEFRKLFLEFIFDLGGIEMWYGPFCEDGQLLSCQNKKEEEKEEK